MALQLNLLHEEILEERQRQRDPLKIGILVLATAAGLLVLYYMWNAYRTLETKSRLASLNRDWAKVEPEVTAAQKRTQELQNVIRTTAALENYIDNRFFWGPLLGKVSACVAPNIQLTSLTGTVLEDNKGIDIMIDGVAAGREPRSAAEDFRQMLLEQFTRNSLGLQTRQGQRSEGGADNEPVVVDGVVPQSPAAEAGLQKGDVIQKLDGHDVKNFADLLGLVRQVELNRKFPLEILRSRNPLKLRAQINEWQPDYTDVTVEFKSLEDVDQIVMVGGSHLAMARYTLGLKLKPNFSQPSAPASGRTQKK